MTSFYSSHPVVVCDTVEELELENTFQDCYAQLVTLYDYPRTSGYSYSRHFGTTPGDS